MKAQQAVRQTTLGDLVVAAFAQAEATTGDRQLVTGMAAQEVSGKLTRAGRADLIRALVSGERDFSGTISLQTRRERRARNSSVSHRPMAAAG